MNIFDAAKDKAADVVDKVKDERRAHEEKAEEDIDADPDVAGARANTDDHDGSYVGRTNPQFDAETQESGAEARSEAAQGQSDG